jgi:iron complex transport system substrate-binding protein
MESPSSSPGIQTQEEMGTITITDALGRTVEVPKSPDYVICSGSGALRYLTYLEAQDKVAVDSIEVKGSTIDIRPYAYANPQFKENPVFGKFMDNDDPEKILTLDPQPQVLFKTYSTSLDDHVELQKKTGISVSAQLWRHGQQPS